MPDIFYEDISNCTKKISTIHIFCATGNSEYDNTLTLQGLTKWFVDIFIESRNGLGPEDNNYKQLVKYLLE